MEIALVAEKDTVTCFKLAGLKRVYSVKNAGEAEKLVNELLKESNLGVILIAERFIDQIHGMMDKIAERKYPLIIPIPGMLAPAAVKTDFIVELIRRKTGVEVKL
ncbi:hypothetical protein HXY33_04415 [Candidatus Bathyarchaeota archaeon]|nr:hypothetical protein [Candidatus Bathyarchaeota archaeon]